MFICRRKTHQSISYRKCLLYLCLFILSLIIFYFLFDKEYFLILRAKRRFLERRNSSKSNIYSKRINLRKENNISKFQPLISSYYPQLPIHMFNQNLTSLKNETKLILLGNEFFGSENWGLSSIEQPSTELMTQLSCPFLSNYCDITTDKNLFSQADAVVYHMRDKIDQYEAKAFRHPDQRFVFTIWESPTYTPNLKAYKNFFNWTMTYRFQSHIVASYYFVSSYIHISNNYYNLMTKENQTKDLNSQFKKVDYQLSDEVLAKKKLGTVAALISNCHSASRRSRVIRQLKRAIDVQVYGQCGRKCPKDIDCREFIAKNYYFFLSFENSLCLDYTTEKLFATLRYPIVPVVYGRTNYSYLLPSSGFIDTNNFDNPISLGKYLKETRSNKEKYLSYFSWKKDYLWSTTTHLSTPFCDLCIRLHLDSTPNVIEDIDAWWNDDICYKPRILK